MGGSSYDTGLSLTSFAQDSAQLLDSLVVGRVICIGKRQRSKILLCGSLVQ